MVTYETNFFDPEQHICHTRGVKVIDGTGAVVEEDPFPDNVGENSDHVLLTLNRATGKLKISVYFLVNGQWKEAD